MRWGLLLIPLLLAMLASKGQAADVAHGKALHDSQCVKCHTAVMGGNPTAIFTRANSHIGSYAELYQQVSRCRDRLNVDWPDENVDDVVAYLNQNFYHFPAP